MGQSHKQNANSTDAYLHPHKSQAGAKPDIRDNLDSRKNEEQLVKTTTATHNRKYLKQHKNREH